MEVPVPKSAGVSARMSRQATKGTVPEARLVAELRRRRFRVEENVGWLPGRPDIVLPTRNLVVFVHGCFWHGCPRHFTLPRNNRTWWKHKIDRNRERDVRKAARLRRMGWSVYTVWEHTDPIVAADRIQRAARG